ncbi:hypothetical protein B484DRAFT_399859 [Ochromonadaceae sp. CCMP2298]|nr:hypothetical protein B484DRAFT_399859 [Ochromonadaceae sp. CCMP2298]
MRLGLLTLFVSARLTPAFRHTAFRSYSARIGMLQPESEAVRSQGFTALDDIIVVQGQVQSGYGRGSKKLGFPTANLPQFDTELSFYGVATGVYCGWASLEGEGPYPCVVNVGKSPTFVGQENAGNILEAHLLDRVSHSEGEGEGVAEWLEKGADKGAEKGAKGEKGDTGGIEEIREIGGVGYVGDGQKGDFYGQYLRLCLAGYLRPEKKFDSFPALVQQITADVASTRKICAEATGDNLGLGGGNALADTYPFMMRYLSAPLRGKGVQKTQCTSSEEFTKMCSMTAMDPEETLACLGECVLMPTADELTYLGKLSAAPKSAQGIPSG